jgi:hypothetical protein
LKKPPPFVPSCLIAIWLATGPRAMTCVPPSSVCAVTEPSKVCTTPREASTTAITSAIGRST